MLKKISIHRFKSCKRTIVELDQPLSALCGRNGVGKTTILQAIDWVARTSTDPTHWRRSLSGESIELNLSLILNESNYEYTISFPQPGQDPSNLTETLSIRDSTSTYLNLFARSDAVIQISETGHTVRIGRATPTLAALRSLLPEDDPLLKHIDLLFSFLRGCRYYTLKDSNKDEGAISDLEYDEWKIRYETDGVATDSVTLRLLYLMKEKRDLLKEIIGIIGPNGLGLINELHCAVPSFGGPL